MTTSRTVFVALVLLAGAADPASAGRVSMPSVAPPPPPPPVRTGIPINYSNPAINAGKNAIDAAKNAMPKPGDIIRQPGGTGAGTGAAESAKAKGGGGTPANRNPYEYIPKTGGDAILDIGISAAYDSSKSKSSGKSGSGPAPGSTTKVANTGPTTSTPTTAASGSLPGPTGGTTPTASDPPDAKQPLTPEEHQRLVDTAGNLDQAWKNLDNQFNEQQRLINKATSEPGKLTPAEQKAIADAGGVPGLEKQANGTADRRDNTHKQYKQADAEAKKNDSYRHVR